MAYHHAFCVQCGSQIVVQNDLGVWNCFKRNFAQADLTFKDGHKARTVICKECVKSPNAEKIMAEILAPGSTAATPDVLESLKKRGIPVTVTEVKEGI